MPVAVNARPTVRLMLPFGISVFCFDFAGSGLSDGEYVTLGAREHKDIECVVQYLRTLPTVSRVALWGRSMGAVSSILYARADPRSEWLPVATRAGALLTFSSFDSCCNCLRQCLCGPAAARGANGGGPRRLGCQQPPTSGASGGSLFPPRLSDASCSPCFPRFWCAVRCV